MKTFFLATSRYFLRVALYTYDRAQLGRRYSRFTCSKASSIAAQPLRMHERLRCTFSKGQSYYGSFAILQRSLLIWSGTCFSLKRELRHWFYFRGSMIRESIFHLETWTVARGCKMKVRNSDRLFNLSANLLPIGLLQWFDFHVKILETLSHARLNVLWRVIAARYIPRLSFCCTIFAQRSPKLFSDQFELCLCPHVLRHSWKMK